MAKDATKEGPAVTTSEQSMVSVPKTTADSSSKNRYRLVEEFTANTLASGEYKIGTELEFGVTESLMIGTDLVAALVGAPSIAVKWNFYSEDAHRLAFGIRGAYLNKNTLLWGNLNEHFDELDAKVARPSIGWTHAVSQRLAFHTFWSKRFGTISAKLSERGRRKLWETKHPGSSYEERNAQTKAPASVIETAGGDAVPDGESEDVDSVDNQEKKTADESSFLHQSVQVQSIAGLAEDRFQLTGEYQRKNGNKVLLTCRVEQTALENLRSNFFRITAAHQWIWSTFQMRLGVGFQYAAISGRDLDEEQIDDASGQPVSDISFYWRF
jgi:hypothetical protein